MMTPNAEEIKSLSQIMAEYAVWATQERTLSEFIEYKMLKLAVDLHTLELAQLKEKWASVPWGDLDTRISHDPYDYARKWFASNAPKPEEAQP